MSMSFNNLDLSNGIASRLLAAMGYPTPIVYTHGEMTLVAAKEGIERAKATVSAEDRPYLDMLANVIEDIERDGGSMLTWS